MVCKQSLKALLVAFVLHLVFWILLANIFWLIVCECLGRGKGWWSLETCLWCSRPWCHILVSCSDWSNVFMLTDSWCCWQYRALSISRSYNLGKDFSKHGFRASNTNFFARLFTYPSAPKRAKNIPVICCKKKKKHSKYGAFLTLFCNKLQSHYFTKRLTYKPTFKRYSIVITLLPKVW